MLNNRFEIKFAQTEEEIQAVYKLRYDDLVLEYNQSATSTDGAGADFSDYDKYAKHLIVKDVQTGTVCGYYRLIMTDFDNPQNKFVCEEEFNIDDLKQSGEKICELSRAVIKKEYRDGIILIMLWKFIVEYMEQCNCRFLMGDASFMGTDREQFRDEICYLINTFPLTDWQIVSRDTLPPMEISNTDHLDAREIMHSLPPLIRAYISAGSKVAPQPFVDKPFGSVDVFVLLDMKNCNEDYIRRISRQR